MEEKAGKGLDMTMEEAFGRLEELLKAMESRDISLEDSFQKYQEGMTLLKACNDKIDTVEKKMLILNESGEADEF